MAILESKNISKSYDDNKALSNVSIAVESGKVFGLLGPNGAGKTTFVKSLLGLLRFDSGEFYIHNTNVDNKSSREKISYLPEKFTFHPFYTVEGALRFFGKLQSIDNLEQKVDKALTRLKLNDLKKRKLKTLSKGQLQRLGLANVFLSEGDLLILDEPFSGLDPIGIRELKEMIKAWKSEGKTLFINSHILSEMQQICDEFAILHEGRLVCQSSMADLSNRSLEDYFYEKVQGSSYAVSPS